MDAYPSKVEIWGMGESGYESRKSEREYITVSKIRGVTSHEPGYGYPREETVDLTLYLDPETGLVVYDIGAYERGTR